MQPQSRNGFTRGFPARRATIALDAVVLATSAAMKWQSDPLIVVVGVVGMALVFLFIWVFLAGNPVRKGARDHTERA